MHLALVWYLVLSWKDTLYHYILLFRLYCSCPLLSWRKLCLDVTFYHQIAYNSVSCLCKLITICSFYVRHPWLSLLYFATYYALSHLYWLLVSSLALLYLNTLHIPIVCSVVVLLILLRLRFWSSTQCKLGLWLGWLILIVGRAH